LAGLQDHLAVNRMGAGLRQGEKFSWDSYAAKMPAAAVNAAISAQYTLARFLISRYASSYCASSVGVRGSAYCPLTLSDFQRLSSYYNQEAFELSFRGGSDLPQIVTLPGLLRGGLLPTDRAERSPFAYAVVDTILLRNLKRFCDSDDVDCIQAATFLRRRVFRTGPFRKWEDLDFGRSSD
jgi:hypothetical protein